MTEINDNRSEASVIEVVPIDQDDRIGTFHTINIKSENTKAIWDLYVPDFNEMHKMCMVRFKYILRYSHIYSFFGKFSYLIISLLSLVNSGFAMADLSSYIIIIVSYVITFIGIVNSAFSFEKKAENFYFISKEYENIAYKIKHLLYNCNNSEKTPEEWYDIINNEIDNLDQIYFTNMNRLSQKSVDSKKSYKKFNEYLS